MIIPTMTMPSAWRDLYGELGNTFAQGQVLSRFGRACLITGGE
jgi:hypothetical protein